MRFADEMMTVILPNGSAMIYIVDQQVYKGMIYIIHNKEMYEYTYPGTLEEAEPYFDSLAHIITHSMEIDKFDLVDDMIEKMMRPVDEDTLELLGMLMGVTVSEVYQA